MRTIFEHARLATELLSSPDNFLSVYSGKPGCACGCRGKYSYRSATRAAASKHRGYPVRDEEVKDNVVNRHLKTMQHIVKTFGDAEVQVGKACVAVETETRLYIATLTPRAAAAAAAA